MAQKTSILRVLMPMVSLLILCYYVISFPLSFDGDGGPSNAQASLSKPFNDEDLKNNGISARAKIPFPLTQRFRPKLQNGIDLSSVDVSYVSSPSWYFLNLFGLRGLFSLILGEENATDDTQRVMQTQMAMQMGGLGQLPQRYLEQKRMGWI